MSKLEVTLPVNDSPQARHVVIDSTGIKVYGEGEWKVRQHGVGKRRTWHVAGVRQTCRPDEGTLAAVHERLLLPEGADIFRPTPANMPCKLNLALDEGTGEILAAVVSTNDWGDSEVLPDLVEQIEGDIDQVSADGAYDTRACYDTQSAAQSLSSRRVRMR